VGRGKPFARHGARGRTGATETEPEGSPLTAYEWISATYPGLSSPSRIEDELTDEQLLGYLDAAQDRIAAAAEGKFNSMVEAVRVGTVFAHNKREYQRWARGQSQPKRGSGLTGQALEAAVNRIGSMFPDNVIRVAA
jgi:hypothetical protein